jgi:3-hydroxyisobutyrate dehydrogenase-like beta-hydroxyacid dehydrogenase
MQVGSAGLGRMGAPMARHPALAGYRVVGYDPRGLRWRCPEA